MEIIAGLLSRAVVEGDWTRTRTILTERRWNGTETWRIVWIGPKLGVSMQVPLDFMCGVLSCCARWGRNYLVKNRTVDWLRAGMLLRAEISRPAARSAVVTAHRAMSMNTHTPIPAMTSPWSPCVAANSFCCQGITQSSPVAVLQW
jgi:hypothetical protein